MKSCILCFLSLLFANAFLHASYAEDFDKFGYVEFCNDVHGARAFDGLYAQFDTFNEFLQAHPTYSQKLYIAKERFIRTKEQKLYSTDFFGVYDESEKQGRNQIAFYYSSHFHEYCFTCYPECKAVNEISDFFAACHSISTVYKQVFEEAFKEIGLAETESYILFKVIKYLPLYQALRPHYDGSLLSLLLDSTDNESLLLAPYTLEFTQKDFTNPNRIFSRTDNQNSSLLIPGTILKDYPPTPHIVMKSGKTRYATVAFAMKSNYTPSKNHFSLLPNFKIE